MRRRLIIKHATNHAIRASSGRSTRINEQGGVWSYVEKPGWDFQERRSRVPLAGRATAPIAYTTGAVVPWAAPRVPVPSNATTPRAAAASHGTPLRWRRRPASKTTKKPSTAGSERRGYWSGVKSVYLQARRLPGLPHFSRPAPGS